MQEMIAIVASVVIGAVIILLLALVQWRGQHTSIDAAQFTSAKTNMLDLVQFMEEDLTNLGASLSVSDMTDNGAGTSANQGGFTGTFGSVAFDTSSTKRTVEFYTLADTLVTNPLVTKGDRVRYEWEATGETVQVLNPTTNTYVSRPTYLLKRFVAVGSAGAFAAAGESMDTITRITFNLYNASGVATNALANVRRVEVTVRAVSPLGGGTAGMVDTEAGVAPAVSETRWHKMFRPPNLARKTG